MRRYKFTGLTIKNTLPFQVTPHLAQRVWSDNRYLPPHIRREPRELLKESPRAAWRSGVPVIPATSYKGALRHLMADYQTRGLSNLSVLAFNYLALGGIKQKGKSPIANSPNNREIEREKYPLVSLFGAAAPVFVRGAIRTFPDLVPTTSFELEEIPIMRTDPFVRDEATIRCNQTEVDELIAAQSGSSASVRAAEKKRDDTMKALRAAKDKGILEDVTKAEAASEAAWRELDAAEQESVVQTGQLHSFFVMPADQSFAHEFRLEARDHELGLLLIGLREFALGGGLLGGQFTRGAGAGLEFTYEVSVEEAGSWAPVGVISNEQIDPSLQPFVDAYLEGEQKWRDNISACA